MENRKQRRKRQRGINKMLKKQELRRDIACKKIADMVSNCDEWICNNCGNHIYIFEMKDGSGTFKTTKSYEDMCDSCKNMAHELMEVNDGANKGTADSSV